jgi:hypothetical protein
MMGVVRTTETSVNFNVTTRRYIPEDSEPHTHRRENLKSHNILRRNQVKFFYLLLHVLGQ